MALSYGSKICWTAIAATKHSRQRGTSRLGFRRSRAHTHPPADPDPIPVMQIAIAAFS